MATSCLRTLAFALALFRVAAVGVEDEDEVGLLQFKQHARPGEASPVPERPVIIDTDVDIDDMMAIIYLLKHPDVDVKAITVETNGWSQQWAGLGNVMRLTQRYGHGDLPVAYAEDMMVTQLNGAWGSHPNMLPKPSYLNGTDNFLTEWVPTLWNPRPPSSMSAPELILHTLREAKDKVDILLLGTYTNLAIALHQDRNLVLSKVGAVYISGGTINFPNRTRTPPRPFRSRGGQTGFPYTDSVEGGNWNMFLDPISTSQVISSGVPLVFMSSNAEDEIFVNETDDRYIPPGCPAHEREYLMDFYQGFGPACDEPMSQTRYWDPSAAVLMTQLMPTFGKGPASICTDFMETNVSVNLQNGPRYSWLEQHSFGAPARLCLAANATDFKVAYYSTACQ